MRGLRLATLLATALAFACALPANAQPVKIRIGWITAPASMVPLLMLAPGAAKHHGKSYTFEPIHFGSSTLQITAISQGEIDIAGFGYTSFPLAIQNAGLTDLRIIADEIQDGAPGYYSTPYFVRKDSGINKIEDIKGKVVGTNGGGSAVDVALRAALKKHGLEEKRDYTMLEGPLPAMPAMLLEKKADLIPAVLPFSFNPKLKEEGKVLFEQREALGVTQMIVWTARKSFIDKNRAAMVDFMEDMLRITRWYQDPKNHDEVAKIASNLTKVSPERFGWLFTKQDTYRDPNLIPNVEALQRNVDVTHDLGFVKKKIDIKNYVDLSLAQEAAKRLK